MRSSQLLAPEFFDLIPALMPRFVRVLEECDLSVAEGFALSCVKHSSQRLDGRPVMLLSDLTHALVAVIGYQENGGGAATVTTKLFERGLLERRRIPGPQKKDLFGQATGSKAAVVLRQEGAEKLEEFKTKFNTAFAAFLSQVPAGLRLTRVINMVSRFTIKSLPATLLNTLHSLPPNAPVAD
jgi:hypothetical protein